MIVNIAKFRYHSENLAIAKFENFSMIEIFSMIAKFRCHSENLAIAKILL